MLRPEWKEVEVPAGEWRIGEDIPAGTYGITTNNAVAVIEIWGTERKDYANYVDRFTVAEGECVGKLKLEKGWLIVLSQSMIFTPPVSLGF